MIFQYALCCPYCGEHLIQPNGDAFWTANDLNGQTIKCKCGETVRLLKRK